ncbi:MAG: UDP-N-acetylmuramate--alanine ligase [Burkholderiaceae bacterium]
MQPPSEEPGLREEIAALAATLIADSGLDYASAKRKAQQQVLGSHHAPRNTMPDNDLVDTALREHLSLFDEGHEDRVSRRRRAALELMTLLEPFNLHLTGAVWKGIVTEHAPIHLQSFNDNAKEMAIELLNRGVRFDAVTVPHLKGTGEAEAMTFYWLEEPVILSAYEAREFRSNRQNSAGQPERGNRNALLKLIAADPA